MSADAVTEVDSFEVVVSHVAQGIRKLRAGIVVSYDPTRRRAKVQPARLGAAPDGQTFPLPVLPSCPVIWPRFGNMVQIGRLNPGDEVLLAVADHELDGFLATGSTYPPKSRRRHNLSDAVVICGLSSDVRPITQGSNGAFFYTGREDGTAYMRIPTDVPGQLELEASTPAGLRLGAAASQPAVLGTALSSALTTFASAVAGSGVTGTAPQNAAVLVAIQGAATALGTALAGILSTKVVIE